MSAIFWIISGIILITLYFLYAGVIMKKNKVKEASAGIDVQLKKRYDLIPNLLNMAAKFMAHESKLMEEITKLRTAAMANSFKDNPQEKIKNEKLLRYYTDKSIEFMRHTSEQNDRLAYMVFAEQRMLPMCAKKLNMSIMSFSDLNKLFKNGDNMFTHTWGMKQQMRDNAFLRADFCRRCIKRIIKDYPEMKNIIMNIENLKQYF